MCMSMSNRNSSCVVYEGCGCLAHVESEHHTKLPFELIKVSNLVSWGESMKKQRLAACHKPIYYVYMYVDKPSFEI